MWTCVNPDWKEAYIERIERAYNRDKNHCSIFSWSTGNESGHGDNSYEMLKWLKKEDPNRLLHSEDASRMSDFSEKYDNFPLLLGTLML
mgnify:CR=1 FL=1